MSANQPEKRLGMANYARSATLALISSPEYPGNLDYKQLLVSFFKSARWINLHETISISATEDLSYLNQVSDLERQHYPMVHFKVVNIEGAGRMLDSKYCQLYLTGAAKNYIPVLKDNILATHRLQTPVVRRYFVELDQLLRPYTTGWLPKDVPMILVSGPPGTGKRQHLIAVATHLSIHLHHIDLNHVLMDTPAATEARIRQELGKAPLYAPCLVHISNLEILIKDTSGNASRLTQAIKGSLFDGYRMVHPLPIVAIFTVEDEDLVLSDSDFGSLFFHHLHLSAPNEQERRHILHFFADEFDQRSVSLRQLAKRTASFVIGDFYRLMLRAHSIRATRQLDCPSAAAASADSAAGNNERDQPATADDEHRLSQADIEAALAEMLRAQAKAVGAPQIPSVRWEDIGGLAVAKKEILDTIQLPLEHPELTEAGLKRSGLLLYGPPGTGKTLLAKAVATECSLNFLSVKGPELINMYVGQSEQNVRDVFRRAREALPCVIFFDELDSLAPNRGKSGESGGVMDRVVSQLLVEMDGLNKSNQLFIIGATNRPDLLDPALLRPGRFDRLVYIPVPDDVDSRLKILTALTRKFDLDPSVDLSALESKCPRGMTGADFYAICSSAMTSALGRAIELIESSKTIDTGGTESSSIISTEVGDFSSKPLTLTAVDFDSALGSFQPSVSAEELLRYEQINKNMSS